MQWVSIDSTIVRAHASATGYKKNQQEKESLGKSKGGLSTKINVLADTLGNSLKFIITPGQRDDITVAHELLENIHDCAVIANKRYDGNFLKKNI